jgi:hypothetical protein
MHIFGGSGDHAMARLGGMSKSAPSTDAAKPSVRSNAVSFLIRGESEAGKDDHAAGGTTADDDVVERRRVHNAHPSKAAADRATAARPVSGNLPWSPGSAARRSGRWRR